MSIVFDENTTQKSGRTLLPRVILVVETDTALRRAIALLLRRDGHVVLALADPAMASEIARENPFSLMLVDLQPTGQLVSFYQQLQASSEAARVPLVLVLQNEREIAQIEQQGIRADDYLLAPLTWKEINTCFICWQQTSRQQDIRWSLHKMETRPCC
jgi:DNA-binding response OmpR family regulator